MRKVSIAVASLILMFLLGASFRNEMGVELPDMPVPASAEAGLPFLIDSPVGVELRNIQSASNTAVDHISKKFVNKLEAVSVTTGSALNTSNGYAYDISLAGEDFFVLPLYVNQSGIFSFSIKEKGTKNTKLVRVEVYKDKECESLIRSFTLDRGKAATMIGRVPLPKKGRYYVKFQAAALQKKETSSFLFTSSLIQGGDRTLFEGETVYTGTGSRKPIYYKVVLDKDAVLAVKGKEYLAKEKIYASLCDMEKRKITKKPILLSEETIYFPAAKGTYLIEIQTEAEIIFTMKTMVIPISDKSGSKKEAAYLLKASNRETGMFSPVGQKISEKWYKMKLTKSESVVIECFGGVSPSGMIRIEFFDASGKRFGERILTKGNEDISFHPSISYKGKNEKKSGYLPAGTYYMKITNTEKETNGYYSIQYQVKPIVKK